MHVICLWDLHASGSVDGRRMRWLLSLHCARLLQSLSQIGWLSYVTDIFWGYELPCERLRYSGPHTIGCHSVCNISLSVVVTLPPWIIAFHIYVGAQLTG